MERVSNTASSDPEKEPLDDASADAAARKAANAGRMTLLLIAGIPVIVILASTWMWFYVASGKIDLIGALGTSNNGELVQPPRQAQTAGWTDLAGVPFALSTPPKWTLVIPQLGNVCDASCEQRLYATRQIHMSLGKELARVQRVLVTDKDIAGLTLAVDTLSDERPMPADFANYLNTEQRGLATIRSESTAFGRLFPELGDVPESWYLMDPNGFVMMRYDPAVDYKDVISDLKFLIKNSNG
ncbi:MAG: hypothetical protein AB8B57_08520 [Congregibacter sp.]